MKSKLFSLLFTIVLLLTWSLGSSYPSKLGMAHEKNFVLKKSDVASFDISVLNKVHGGTPNWSPGKDAILNEGFPRELKFVYKDYNCSTMYALLKRRYESYKYNINYKNTADHFRS